jgi:hypothetical protein
MIAVALLRAAAGFGQHAAVGAVDQAQPGGVFQAVVLAAQRIGVERPVARLHVDHVVGHGLGALVEQQGHAALGNQAQGHAATDACSRICDGVSDGQLLADSAGPERWRRRGTHRDALAGQALADQHVGRLRRVRRASGQGRGGNGDSQRSKHETSLGSARHGRSGRHQ